MNTRLQRFDFGSLRDFRGPMPIAPSPDDIRIDLPEAPPPPPVFSEAELEAVRLNARAEGYAQGFAEGTIQAVADANAVTTNANAAIHHLAEQLSELEATYFDLLKKESSDLSELVLMIAKKVAGDALDTRSIEAITSLVTHCLPVFFSRPRLTIDVHPDALDGVMGRVEPLLHQHGFEGEIHFRSNAGIGAHDALLDWGAGQAHRSTHSLWQEIESLLQRIPLTLPLPETVSDTPTPDIGA